MALDTGLIIPNAVVSGSPAFQNGELVTLGPNRNVARAMAGVPVLGAIRASSPVSNGGQATVVTNGLAMVRLEAGLTPVGGDALFVSAISSGLATTAPGATNALVGYVFDASMHRSENPLVQAVLIGPQESAADWPLGENRYYAVDPVNGDDSNLGYSDVSFAAAGAVALKTLEALAARLPANGAGRSVWIGLASGTYLKQDGATIDDCDLSQTSNWGALSVRVTDFTGSAADRMTCGGVIDGAGPNANQSWTIQTIASDYDVTVAAGTLPGQNALGGRRVRVVDANGVTKGCGMAQRRIGAAQFYLGEDLAAADNGDTFFLERPSAIIGRIIGGSNIVRSRDSYYPQFVGLRMTTSPPDQLQYRNMQGTFAFCEFTQMTRWVEAGQTIFDGYYIDETGTQTRVGSGVLSRLEFQFFGGVTRGPNIRVSAFLDEAGTITGPIAIYMTGGPQVGDGCYFNGMTVRSSFFYGYRLATSRECYIGRAASATTYRDLYIEKLNSAQPTFFDACAVALSNIVYNANAPALMRTGVRLFLNNIVLSTGFSTLEDSRGCQVVLQGTNTLGDFGFAAGSLTITQAEAEAYGVRDAAGNEVFGEDLFYRPVGNAWFAAPARTDDPAFTPPANRVHVWYRSDTNQLSIRDSGGTVRRATFT